MARPRRGLFWRVYAILLASLFLVAVIGGVIWRVASPGPMHPLEIVQGRVIGALLPPADADPAETRATLARLSDAVHGRVILKDGRGRVIGEAAQGRRLVHPGTPHAIVRRFIHLDDGRLLQVDAPIRIGAQGRHMLMMLLLAAGVVGLAAYPVVSGITGRLERLRGSVEAWGRGGLHSRARVEGADEVAAVAETFNAAADRIEGLLAAHKAMLAHASHELRSPLARLRVAAEMYASAPRAELKAVIDREVAELDALVEEILLASRLDHGPTLEMGPPEAVDILALAAEEAARAGVELKAVEAGAAPFEVPGWPRLLRRMIRNLVENALQHGGPPVEVEVAADAGGAGIVLTVSDRGRGIPHEECERVFEPFHRPAGRPETEGGWGLGLSLVRQIAQRHAGGVRCLPREGGGTTFVVTLPRG